MVMLTVIQVGIVEDHFQCQSDRKRLAGIGNHSDSTLCGCSRCRTRYLVSCTAYESGSYWLPTIEGYREEYTFSPARKPSREMLNVPVRAKSHGGISGKGYRARARIRDLNLAQGTRCRNVMQNVPGHSLPTSPQVQAILPETGCCSSTSCSHASAGKHERTALRCEQLAPQACGLIPRKMLVLSLVTRRPSRQPAKGGASKRLLAKFSSLHPRNAIR
jgi:hypothetical protein